VNFSQTDFPWGGGGNDFSFPFFPPSFPFLVLFLFLFLFFPFFFFLFCFPFLPPSKKVGRGFGVRRDRRLIRTNRLRVLSQGKSFEPSRRRKSDDFCCPPDNWPEHFELILHSPFKSRACFLSRPHARLKTIKLPAYFFFFVDTSLVPPPLWRIFFFVFPPWI